MFNSPKLFVRKEYGQAVRREQLRRGITVRQMAQESKVSEGSLNRILPGLTDPSIENYMRINAWVIWSQATFLQDAPSFDGSNEQALTDRLLEQLLQQSVVMRNHTMQLHQQLNQMHDGVSQHIRRK